MPPIIARLILASSLPEKHIGVPSRTEPDFYACQTMPDDARRRQTTPDDARRCQTMPDINTRHAHCGSLTHGV